MILNGPRVADIKETGGPIRIASNFLDQVVRILVLLTGIHTLHRSHHAESRYKHIYVRLRHRGMSP